MKALEFEALLHVANLFANKERWSQVMSYLQRANRMRHQPARRS